MKINEYSSAMPASGASRAMPAAAFRSVHRGNPAEQPVQAVQASISSSAKLVGQAIENLRDESEIRDEAVAAARAKLRKWQGLDPGQVDRIALDMLSDLF